MDAGCDGASSSRIQELVGTPVTHQMLSRCSGDELMFLLTLKLETLLLCLHTQ